MLFALPTNNTPPVHQWCPPDSPQAAPAAPCHHCRTYSSSWNVSHLLVSSCLACHWCMLWCSGALVLWCSGVHRCTGGCLSATCNTIIVNTGKAESSISCTAVPITPLLLALLSSDVTCSTIQHSTCHKRYSSTPHRCHHVSIVCKC